MLDKTMCISRIPFDINNFEHRKVVAKFNATGRWDEYFEPPLGCKNLPYTLTVACLTYYVNAEARYLDEVEAM